MNRIRMVSLGVVLAVGAGSMPLAQSAFAAHKTHTTATTTQTGTRTSTTRTNGAGMMAYVASVVGVTPAVLQADLQAGKTLLQIAGTKYATADALATALLAPVKTALDAATTGNKLSTTRAGTLYTKAHALVAILVVTPHPALGLVLAAVHGARGHAKTHGVGGLISTLATACNTTTTALHTAIAAGGKTLLAICQATNASATQESLVTALLAPTKSKLDKAVTANTITAAQETTRLATERTELVTLITTPLPVGGLHLHP